MTQFIVYNTPAMVLAIIAGILAYKRIEGWGWFLLVAALITASPK